MYPFLCNLHRTFPCIRTCTHYLLNHSYTSLGHQIYLLLFAFLFIYVLNIFMLFSLYGLIYVTLCVLVTCTLLPCLTDCLLYLYLFLQSTHTQQQQQQCHVQYKHIYMIYKNKMCMLQFYLYVLYQYILYVWLCISLF